MYAFLFLCLLGGTTAEIKSTKFGYLWYLDEIIRAKSLVPVATRDNMKHIVTSTKESDNITRDVLEETFKTCDQRFRERQELEKKLARKGKVISLNSRKTDSSLIRSFRADPQIHTMESSNVKFEEATYLLYKKFNLSSDTIVNDLPSIDTDGELGRQNEEACTNTIFTARCDPKLRYRRIDGECNNLQNPRWGSAMNCQPRLLPPNYVGASGFRRSVNGEPLPAPRSLSLNVHYNYNRPTNYVTHMYMFFGQLLDHDIAQTPMSTTIDNQAIECCPPENETHPQCSPILLSRNDPFYSQFNQRCINFVRSAICPTCSLGPRQVMNQVTSTIDASFVYGNSENETNSLRTNDGAGRLRITRSAYGDLLPQSPDPVNDQCSFPDTNDICFQAGDARANQHTVLASLHTIFLREHNRIANVLRQINPWWDDERIFQETRRILGAQMQAITYKEYLPITLGNDRMTYFNLWTGRWTRYDNNVDPTTMVEFTTAAFRFGHSMINSIVANRPLNDSNQLRLLRNEFFQPFELYRGIIGPVVEGASNTPAQWFDRHVVPDVTNFLYRIRGNATGLDLASINIQRGRDHGLPTYVDTVRYCSDGAIDIGNFYDLVGYRLMRQEQADVLANNYRFVQDVDLWPGILSEIPNEGAVVGPTATCIIGLQFKNLKFGDRFYFEHVNEAGSFTYQQLQEIRRATLSQIICLNARVSRLPRNAMLFSSRNNPYIECRYVRGIDLSYWKA